MDYLHQRTCEGIETARESSKQIGRASGSKVTTKKSIEAKKAILAYSKDFNGQMKDCEIMRMLGCARKSYYRWKKQLREEIGEVQ